MVNILPPPVPCWTVLSQYCFLPKPITTVCRYLGTVGKVAQRSKHSGGTEPTGPIRHSNATMLLFHHNYTPPTQIATAHALKAPTGRKRSKENHPSIHTPQNTLYTTTDTPPFHFQPVYGDVHVSQATNYFAYCRGCDVLKAIVHAVKSHTVHSEYVLHIPASIVEDGHCVHLIAEFVTRREARVVKVNSRA